MFTVASHCQIMEQLDLKDLSHKLVAIYVIKMFKRLIWQSEKVKNFEVGFKQGMRCIAL